MKKLLEDAEICYRPKLPPAGHDIRRRFASDNGGAIPSTSGGPAIGNPKSEIKRSVAPLEPLVDLFHRLHVATMPEMKAILGTHTDATVFRKLATLRYQTSYSHRGAFYTLQSIPRFDPQGLWCCRGAWFSRHGTLLDTAVALVNAAPAGYLVSELEAVLHVRLKDPLRRLVRTKRLQRQDFHGFYLYLAKDRIRRQKQRAARQDQETNLEIREEEFRAARALFFGLLDEQQRRLYAGLESFRQGHGGDRRLAQALGLDEETVARGRRELLAGEVHPPDRARRPGGGRHLKLTGDQLKRLEQSLSEGATRHGWQNNLWTAKRVAKVIRKHLGVSLCIATVRKMLTEQLGWSLQKPAMQLRDRDEDAIARWKTEGFSRIRQLTWHRHAHLTFIDESGFMLAPTLRRTYAPRGHAPILEVSDPHARISVVGAITVSPKCRRIRFIFHMLPDNANFHGESVAEFLRDLSGEVKGPNTIIWDSVRIHLAEPVQNYLSATDGIVTEMFPPNAPNLNPVDGVWSYIKSARLPNYTPYDLFQLRRKLTTELRRLQRQPALLLSFIARTGLDITGVSSGNSTEPGHP